MTTIQHLKLVGELGVAVSTLSAAGSPLEKIKAAAAVRDLLAKIGARAKATTPAITIDMDDAAVTAASIRAYAETGLQALPVAHRKFEAVMVSSLAASIGERALAQNVGAQAAFPTDDDFLAAYQLTSSRGVSVPFDQAAMRKRLVDAREERAGRLRQYAGAVESKKAEIDTFNRQGSVELQAIEERIKAAYDSGDEQGVVDAIAEKKAFHERYLAEWGVLRDQLQAAHAEHVKAFNEPQIADDQALQAGVAAIDAVMAASPVTEQQAREWAARQMVVPATAALLKKRGYKIEALRQDMADFYRLTGGKIAEIEISTARSGRAHASGILETGGRKFVAVGKDFNRAVLFHELAHHLETDAIARAGARGFLIKRRESASAYRLRELTGNKGYGPGEVAWKDQFLNPYIGKVYHDGVTEVFSMGVQMLADPVQAAKLAAEDPEMFALISGYISKPMSPAMQALVLLHSGAVASRRDAEKDVGESFDAAIKAFADTVVLQKDEPTMDSAEMMQLRGQFKERKEPVYVGRDGPYHVFMGILRNHQTKRWSTGYLVAVSDGPGMWLRMASFHEGFEIAKAAIALARADEETPSQIKHRYFVPGMRSGDYRQTLIKRANETS